MIWLYWKEKNKMRRSLKKPLAVILCLVMVFGSAPLAGFVGLDLPSLAELFTTKAEATTSGTCGDNLTWTLTSTGILTITGTGVMTDYTANSLGISTSPWSDTIKVVKIESGIKNIGEYAFSNCRKLTSVTIPDSITSIGAGAFYYCTGLTSVTIPDSVINIGERAFYKCTSLISIEIPDSVTSIGDSAFFYCEYLSGVNIPNGVISIGRDAFFNCRIRSVTLPDSIKEIGTYAFKACSWLTSVTISDSITNIPEGVFSNCSSLNTVYYSGTHEQWGNVTIETYNDYLSSCSIVYDCNSEKPYTSYGTYGNGVYWKLTVDNELVIYGIGEIKNRSDATWYDDYASSIKNITIEDGITGIGEYAFGYCSALENITIPDSVTSIGADAFVYCTALESITIPDSVKSIGDEAFAGCSKLASITIPDGVTSIGEEVFFECTKLKNITLPSSITSIGDYAFYNCTALTDVYYKGDLSAWCNINFVSLYSNPSYYASNVYINGDLYPENLVVPDDVTAINDNVFINFKNIKSVTIHDKVTSIGRNSFSGCSGIENIVIPNSVTTLGQNAFGDCKSLKSAELSNEIITISAFAFSDCINLESVLIPDSVTQIGAYAFDGCTKISTTYYTGTKTEWNAITIGDYNESISKYVVYEYGTDNANYGSGTIGSTITWILYENGDLVIEGSGAIPNYSESSVPWHSVREKIKNVYIPEGVTNMGASVFIGCVNIEKFVVDENNAGFVADEYGVLYNINKTKLVKYPAKSTYTEYTVPESVESIRPKAFEEALNLTSVTLNTGITEIGDSAFIGCTNIIAANYCGTQENWNTVTVGANNESLTNSLVYEYGTENFNYGKGTCGTNLTWVLYGNGSLVISGTGSMDDYSAGSAPWSNLSSKIVLIKISDGVTTIGNSAFAFCSSAETVEIPSSITTIGDAAFAECDKLKTVSVPYGVKTVGADAFRDCDLLESVVLADSVTTLGDSAFYMCDSLKTVTLSNKIQKIDDYTFYKCISLENLVIPDSVTYIGYYAFYYCGQLKELTMPVTARIYNSYYVFSGCTEIDKITLTKGTTGVMLNYGTSTSSSSTITNYEYTPWYISGCPEVVIADGVKSIGECAFYDCGKLKKLTLPGSLDSMGYMSFYYMSGLSDIYFTGTLADWCEITIDNVHVVNHAENLYINGKLVEGDLVIPDGVTYVGDKAFFNVDSITSVTIPNSVNQIGTYAFASCDGITNVKTGNGVTIIEDYAFVECPAMTTLVIGNNVANIGNGAFMSCVELRELTMPVTAKIYNSEDTFYGCKKLEKVTLTKGTTGIMQDYGTSTSETSTITNYKYTPWYISDSCKEIIIEDGITNIGNYAFRGCHQCISVIIPDSVTKIGTYAFYECYNIKTLKIPDAVTTIGNSAFYNCTGLKELTMPISANIYNSGDTFGYCNNIEKIIFTKGTGSMPDYGTSELANSSTTNYKYTPWYISGCSKIVLPSGISTIGEYAFHECSNLTTVNFDGTIDDYYDIYIKDYNDPLFNARTNFGSYKITWIFGETTEQETFFAGEEIITPYYECEKGYSIVWSPEVPEIMPAQNLTFTAFFEKINYKVEWNIEGVISEETYTYGQILNVPSVPSKLGYEFVGWTPTVPETMPDYELSFTAVFEPISYTATFISEGVVVSTQTFTVETEKLVEPDVPQKAGYFACWDYYELKGEDIIISAKYYLPDAVMIPKLTLYVGDTYRLLPSCNFEVTNKVWKSNDTSVATVNQNGKISAVGEGNCKITVVCYGKDSLGNDVKATESTEIIVKEQPKKTDVKQTFREMFDEFFEVTLHDLLFNLREFLIVLFRYAY